MKKLIILIFTLILACSNQQEYSCSNRVETFYLDIKPNNVSYKFGTSREMTKLTVLSNDKFNLIARQNWKNINQYMEVNFNKIEKTLYLHFKGKRKTKYYCKQRK